MTDQQQIEVWRKDFESNFIDGRLDRFDKSGHYVNDFREALWQGFLMAKRAHKPVELPKYMPFESVDKTPEANAHNKLLHDIRASLNAANIQYTVKGE